MRRGNCRVTNIPCLFLTRAPAGEGVEVEISCRLMALDVTSTLCSFIRAKSITPNFRGCFQKQLYDSLHDYVVEMFTRNPQRQN